jgi:hypothetical protein
MIWQTWKHGSLFSRHSFKKLRYAFGIAAFMMLLLCTVTVIGGILILGNNAGQLSEAEMKPLVIKISGAGILFIGCVVVTVAIGRLTGSKINAIGRLMHEMLDDTLARVNEPPPEAYSLIRIDRPAGLLWILLGVVVFIFGAALGSFIWDFWLTSLNAKGNPLQLMQLSTLVEIGGALLVLKGRAYFTPKAETVLAIDKRTPVLYLRSFLDETPDTVQWSSASAFVDRSLEMKLARYFLPFGTSSCWPRSRRARRLFC